MSRRPRFLASWHVLLSAASALDRQRPQRGKTASASAQPRLRFFIDSSARSATLETVGPADAQNLWHGRLAFPLRHRFATTRRRSVELRRRRRAEGPMISGAPQLDRAFLRGRSGLGLWLWQAPPRCARRPMKRRAAAPPCRASSKPRTGEPIRFGRVAASLRTRCATPRRNIAC